MAPIFKIGSLALYLGVTTVQATYGPSYVYGGNTPCVPNNLLANGDFETGAKSPWAFVTAGSVSSVISEGRNTNYCRNGAYCYDSTELGSSRSDANTYQTITTVAGRTYTLTGYSRAVSAVVYANCKVAYYFGTTKGSTTEVATVDKFNDRTTWIQSTGTFTATGSTTYIILHSNCGEGVGEVYFDDISVTDNTQCSTTTSTSVTSTTSAAPVCTTSPAKCSSSQLDPLNNGDFEQRKFSWTTASFNDASDVSHGGIYSLRASIPLNSNGVKEATARQLMGLCTSGSYNVEGWYKVGTISSADPSCSVIISATYGNGNSAGEQVIATVASLKTAPSGWNMISGSWTPLYAAEYFQIFVKCLTRTSGTLTVYFDDFTVTGSETRGVDCQSTSSSSVFSTSSETSTGTTDVETTTSTSATEPASTETSTEATTTETSTETSTEATSTEATTEATTTETSTEATTTETSTEATSTETSTEATTEATTTETSTEATSTEATSTEATSTEATSTEATTEATTTETSTEATTDATTTSEAPTATACVPAKCDYRVPQRNLQYQRAVFSTGPEDCFAQCKAYASNNGDSSCLAIIYLDQTKGCGFITTQDKRDFTFAEEDKSSPYRCWDASCWDATTTCPTLSTSTTQTTTEATTEATTTETSTEATDTTATETSTETTATETSTETTATETSAETTATETSAETTATETSTETTATETSTETTATETSAETTATETSTETTATETSTETTATETSAETTATETSTETTATETSTETTATETSTETTATETETTATEASSTETSTETSTESEHTETSTSSAGPTTNSTYPPVTSSSASLTTSTVTTTHYYTVTSCPPYVKHCHVGEVTSTIYSYTTTCPAGSNPTPPAMTTSVVYKTKEITITACPPAITNCPYGKVTKVLTSYTTICPIEEVKPTSKPGAHEKPVYTAVTPAAPGYPAANPEAPVTHVYTSYGPEVTEVYNVIEVPTSSAEAVEVPTVYVSPVPYVTGSNSAAESAPVVPGGSGSEQVTTLATEYVPGSTGTGPEVPVFTGAGSRVMAGSTMAVIFGVAVLML